MTQVVFNSYNFQIEDTLQGRFVFDIIRKKKVLLTPEEWVRQHILHYLVFEKNYSKNLIAIERAIEVNGLTKRFDILVFDRAGKPYLMVECKAQHIELNEQTLNQILVYNQALFVPYLWISNGKQNFCYQATGTLQLLHEIPEKPHT